jgi:hypothetical protein
MTMEPKINQGGPTMKNRPCIKCQVNHSGKYAVCQNCIEGINTQWTVNAQNALKKLQAAL